MKRWSLRRRAAMVLLGAFAVAAAWATPSGVHEWRMEREISRLKSRMAAECGGSPSLAATTAWLGSKGFIGICVGPYSGGNETPGQSLHAEKMLSGGTLLWRPSTAKVFVRYSVTGEFREAEWWHWPFDAGAVRSRFRGELQGIGGFAIHAALLWIIVLWIRRHRRRRMGLCECCAYPIGQSPVCTECGAAVTAVTPKPSSTPTA